MAEDFNAEVSPPFHCTNLLCLSVHLVLVFTPYLLSSRYRRYPRYFAFYAFAHTFFWHAWCPCSFLPYLLLNSLSALCPLQPSLFFRIAEKTGQNAKSAGIRKKTGQNAQIASTKCEVSASEHEDSCEHEVSLVCEHELRSFLRA